MTLPIVIGIDFETADMGPDSACAIGMARLRDGVVEDRFYRRIRPPRSRVRFTEIHGLTWSMLKDQPIFAELWPDIRAFMTGAQWLVAHNAPFDRRILRGCCAAADVAAPPIPFACTLKGARRNLPLASKKLDAVCAHFGISLQHHHAGSDATAAALIFLRLTEMGISPESMGC